MNKTQRNLLENVVIVDFLRTAVGRANKGISRLIRPDDMAAHVIRGIVDKNDLDPKIINDIRLGCAFPEGEQGMQPARVAGVRAGLPEKLSDFIKVPAMTINRYCASGLQAIADEIAHTAIGFQKIAIAGGMETMTLIPMGGNKFAPNPKLAEEYPDFYLNMGLTAENLAELDNITREEQDKFSLTSHQRAVAAQKAEKFKNEILPYKAMRVKLDESEKKVTEELDFLVDEGPRENTNLKVLARLPTPFKKNGTVSPGNSSQMSDGAAVVMIMTIEEAKRLGLKPLARLIAYEKAAVPPEIMGIGPVEAIPKALKMANLKINDIDIIELNEAFAAQSLSVIKRLKEEKKIELDLEKLNVNGGAIALGHPLGCTGAYLTIKGLNELRRRKGKYLMVTMCIGEGQGAAGIFEAIY